MPTLDNVRRPGRRVEAHKPRKVEPVAAPPKPLPPLPPPPAMALFLEWRHAHMVRDYWRAARVLAELEGLARRHVEAAPCDEPNA